MRKRISQREAVQLRKDVAELRDAEDRRRRWWATEWPNGTHIGTVALDRSEAAVVRTARKLGHAVVLTIDANGDSATPQSAPVGADGSEKLTARIDADLERLKGMRGYVTGRGMEQEAAPKRTRGKGKKAAAAVEAGAVQS